MKLNKLYVLENARFHPSTRKRENGVFKNLFLGNHLLRKPAFLVPGNPVNVWTEG